MTNRSILMKLDWAKLLYSHFTNEIQFTKKTQWKITYYSVAIMGGIYLTIKDIDITNNLKYLLIFFIFFISFTSIFFIIFINRTLRINRLYLHNIKDKYPTISVLISETFKEREKDLSITKDIPYLIILIGSILISAIYIGLLVWHIGNKSCMNGQYYNIIFDCFCDN